MPKSLRQFERLEPRLTLAPVIDVGDHYLLPDTPGQQVQVWVTSGDAVEGVNFNSQIGDGLSGGPVLQDIDLENGTIFEGNNTGQIDPEWLPGSVVRTFTISNTGDGDLLLTGIPPVTVEGVNADDFTVIRQPDAVIHPGESTSFDVEFRPLGSGLRTATLVVPNNDPDEDPYTFAIQGTGQEGDIYPQWEGRYIVTDTGTVAANGLLATITIDTTGLTAGTWGLVLGPNNLNGSTDFAGAEAVITDGRIIINSAPVGVADTFTTAEDVLLIGNVLANDSDADGDPLTAALVAGPAHGALTLNADGSFQYTPDANYNGSDGFIYTATDGHFTTDPVQVSLTITPVTDLLAANIVYANSYWDGNNPGVDAAELMAVAPDKIPLRVGQTASYANVSNYAKGINEVLIVADDLDPATVDLADFMFLVGNSDDLSTWRAAPVPTITVQENVGDVDLIFLTWPDGSIKGQWLYVAWNEAAQPFLFGSAPGDIGNSTTDFTVNATDVIQIRNHPRLWFNPATIDSIYDINRDSLVNATDMVLARRNATTFANDLNWITPSWPGALTAALSRKSAIRITADAEIDWLAYIEPKRRAYLVETPHIAADPLFHVLAGVMGTAPTVPTNTIDTVEAVEKAVKGEQPTCQTS